ncbi:ribosome biogenesis GTPase YlqF [Trichloromonas sp.]|uniref:ribosome biogenesis GTPase YlqF n=1 Tax=Trichloromonas sp. TaxID=3069249 RepID=UPI003D81A0C5
MKIEWYPGHMTKASRLIADVIMSFHVVIEVLDARLPLSSANPVLKKLRQNKPCIKVLNKSDLADPDVTKAWIRYFEKENGVRALPFDSRKRSDVGLITTLAKRLAPSRCKPGFPLRAMVIGIPNVGKSTLINTLAGKRMARIGDRPAITTCNQQIDLRNGIMLSDTPGLLWPVMDDQDGAYRLASSGAIGDSALDYVEVARFTADYLMQRYPKLLLDRYNLAEIPETSIALIEEIGRRRGCLVAGGEIDLHRSAEAFIREFRGGKIGRISLEEPPETT